jgi:hypothetical protein
VFITISFTVACVPLPMLFADSMLNDSVSVKVKDSHLDVVAIM